MAIFTFKGRSPNGKKVEGQLSAMTSEEAMSKLLSEGFEVENLTAKASKSEAKVGSVPIKDLQIFTRQMATLVDSGVHISQSLELMSQSTLHPNLKKGLGEIQNHVTQGMGLADAMSKFPKVFDRLYLSMIRAGEEGGVLDVIFDRLAKYIESSVKLRSKVKSALWYPISVIAIAIIVILAIFIFVIPQFQKLFTSSGQELPYLTKVVINISYFVTSYWYLIIAGVVGIVFFVKKYYESDAGKTQFDFYILRIPLFGSLIRISSVARFSRTLATLLSSGVTIVDALEISSNVVGNGVIEGVIRSSKDSITKGKSLSSIFLQSKEIPQMVSHMISVGEQTGNLDDMLNKVADFYEDEVENMVSAMTSVIEPVLMIVLGSIIAVIVISMYLPIFNLANIIGG